MDVRVCKWTGVKVRSREAVCEVGLRCREDVDDEVRRGSKGGGGGRDVSAECGCHAGGDAEREGDEGEGVECDGSE